MIAVTEFVVLFEINIYICLYVVVLFQSAQYPINESCSMNFHHRQNQGAAGSWPSDTTAAPALL